MTRFKVIHNNPKPYKSQILQMWENNLPDTPPGRFEWMSRGNPAGEALWFFAFEEKSDEMVGTISIMPKDLFLNGRKVRGGILGDFMIAPKYRVFGPALTLPKTACEHFSKMGFQFIYTIPNAASKKIMERVGFRDVDILHKLAKPINAKYYLDRYLPVLPSRLTALLADQLLKIFSIDTYVPARGIFKEVFDLDGSFDRLWNEKTNNEVCAMGSDHSSSYLTWKYLRNPEHDFRIITFKASLESDLSGYVVFWIESSTLFICDIFALNRSSLYALLKKMVSVARINMCHAIYVQIIEGNPWLKMLKVFGFVDTKDDMFLSFLGNRELLPEKWLFFGGDRNI